MRNSSKLCKNVSALNADFYAGTNGLKGFFSKHKRSPIQCAMKHSRKHFPR